MKTTKTHLVHYVRSTNPATGAVEMDRCESMWKAVAFAEELRAAYANEWGSTEPIEVVTKREAVAA